MSSAWWRDRVLVDLTKWWERIHTRCQDHIKVPIRCHLSVHWCLISCSKTFVLTCSRRAVWIQCVCESVWFGMGGGLWLKFLCFKRSFNYGCECKVWFSLILRSFWMVYSGITSEIWSHLNYCMLKYDFTLSFERRKGTFFLLLKNYWSHTVRNKTRNYLFHSIQSGFLLHSFTWTSR